MCLGLRRIGWPTSLLMVGLACTVAAAQELPVHTTARLPDGSTQPVYRLVPEQRVMLDVPTRSATDNFTRWRRYRWSTWDRAWFALPIEQAGYYAVFGATRKLGPDQLYEDQTLLGVYDRLEAVTRPNMQRSHVLRLPLRRHEPDLFVFRGEPGQLWAAELVMGSDRKDKPVVVGATRADVISPEQTRHGRLERDFPFALFELDTSPGEGYELALQSDETIGLILLEEAGPTAFRVLSSSKPLRGEYATPVLAAFAARRGTGYLAMLMLNAEKGDYGLHFRQTATTAQAPLWHVIRDDDGEQDSAWGQVSGKAHVLRKELVLGEDPAEVKMALIQYRIGSDPYDWDSSSALGMGTPADKQWGDLEIYLNDHLALRRPLDEAGRSGWYEFAIDPAWLKPGVNSISFTKEGGNDCYYLAIDLDTDYDRSYCTLDGEVLEEELRPCIECKHHVGGHGEYMIRLKYLTDDL